jgi:hypothetical protein
MSHQHSNSNSHKNRRNVGSSVFYAVNPAGCMTAILHLREKLFPVGFVPRLYHKDQQDREIPYVNDTPMALGTHLALFADDTYIYVKHKPCVPCKLQHSLTAVNSWCECWNIKINVGKTWTIYFTRRLKVQ